jgi:hypothetical protein
MGKFQFRKRSEMMKVAMSLNMSLKMGLKMSLNMVSLSLRDGWVH